MASKRRLRRKACMGKQRHESQDRAIAHIISLQRAGKIDGHMNPYRCGFCGSWHVGHAPRRLA